MTKTELAERLNRDYNCTKKDADALVNAVFDIIREELVAGNRVSIAKFGTFEVRDRGARMCKNPQTGEPVAVAACKAPTFKPSKALKADVNE